MNDKLWKECIGFHGHECPGLASGYRAAEIAMESMNIPLVRAKDEELVCVAENEACGIDCIQCLLSCTVGKGNLILRPTGKMAYSFFNRETGQSVRLVMRQLDRSCDRELLIEHILTAPGDEIFDMKEPTFQVPEKARLFDSIQCERCKEFCREDKIRFQGGKKYCIDCFDAYDRG